MGKATCAWSSTSQTSAKANVSWCINERKKEHPGGVTGPMNCFKRPDGKYECSQTYEWDLAPPEPKPEPEPEPKPVPRTCSDADVWDTRKNLGDVTYQGTDSVKGRYSSFLAAYNAAKGKPYELVVHFGQKPKRVIDVGVSKPAAQSQDTVFYEWEHGTELQRIQCPADTHWYWVGFYADLKDLSVPEPKTLRQQWDDFFKNPDVITAIGLTPSSIQESFSLVFSGYSIINDREQSPEPGDYVSVGLIIAGVTLAAATALWTVMPGVGAVADLSYIEPGLTAGRLIGMGLPGFLATLKAAALHNPLLALLLLTQVDIIFWGPSVLRDPIEKLVSNATGYRITLENAIRNNEWEIGKMALTNLENTYSQMDKELSGAPVKFFEMLGVNYADFRAILENGKAALEAYRTAHPQLVGLPVTFPKEFLLDDVKVEDGDTLFYPGHPEAGDKIRILGIDAHEAETEAGKEETGYLKSLIEGKQVRILTHEFGDPEKTIGEYGRLLAGVFLGDQDVALAMLEHFGKSLLVASKYQKKYRWIDWDEYKRVAEAAVGPPVKEFKIYIDSDPSRARLYIDGKYTHHFTPSDARELKDVMDMLEPGEHVIKAEKAGKAASVTVTILEGSNPDIMLTLKTVGLEPVEPEPEEPPTEPPVEEFEFKILSTPLRAKVYVDGVYTHHLTPSDEKELSDVMHLLTPGKHVIRATKAGRMAEKEVEITAGINEPVYLTLSVVGLPRSKEDLLAEIQGYRFILEQLEAELAKL